MNVKYKNVLLKQFFFFYWIQYTTKIQNLIYTASFMIEQWRGPILRCKTVVFSFKGRAPDHAYSCCKKAPPPATYKPALHKLSISISKQTSDLFRLFPPSSSNSSGIYSGEQLGQFSNGMSVTFSKRLTLIKSLAFTLNIQDVIIRLYTYKASEGSPRCHN